VDEVQSILRELDISKGAGPDGIPPLILMNFASTVARPILLFLTDIYLHECAFPDKWKLSCVITIFKKSRRNNVEDYRGVMAILSAILKSFELLVFRAMYNDLKNLMSVNEHGFINDKRPINGDEVFGVRSFCAEFN
jgi:hypothetical protein